MTTPHVSVAITVSLQVSNEPVYTTVTSSSIPAIYMFTVVPARCVLDYVWILSLDLAGLPLANVLQSFDSYVCPSLC